MDYRGFSAGVEVMFPVSVPGALFFLGDVHAQQGDGEIVGTGIETAAEVTFTVRVLKGKQIGWPRGINADEIFTIGNARPLDQALQHATTEMLDWLMADYGSTRWRRATSWDRPCAMTSPTSSTPPTRWPAGSRGSALTGLR